MSNFICSTEQLLIKHVSSHMMSEVQLISFGIKQRSGVRAFWKKLLVKQKISFYCLCCARCANFEEANHVSYCE